MKRSQYEQMILEDLLGKPSFKAKVNTLKTSDGKEISWLMPYSIVNFHTMTNCRIVERMQADKLIKVFMVNPHYAHPTYIVVPLFLANQFAKLDNCIECFVKDGDVMKC